MRLAKVAEKGYRLLAKANHNHKCTLAESLLDPYAVEILQSNANPWMVLPTDAHFEHRSNKVFRGSSSSGPTPTEIAKSGGVFPRIQDAPEEKMGLSNVDKIEGTLVHTSRSEKVARNFATAGGWVSCFKQSTGVNVMYLLKSSQEALNTQGESNNFSKHEAEIFLDGVPFSDIEFIRPMGQFKMLGYAPKIVWNLAYDSSNDWFRIEHGSFNSNENERGNKAAREQGALSENMQIIPAAWAKKIYKAICEEFPAMSLKDGTSLRSLCL